MSQCQVTVPSVMATILLFMTNLFYSTYCEKQKGESADATKYVHDGEEIRPLINPKRNTYVKDLDQLWVLQEDLGVWALVFHSMSIEDSPKCRHDYLEIREIYDGINKTTYTTLPAERYCGSDVPHPYISQRPHVEIRFITDSLWEMEGFHIKVIHALNTDSLREKLQKYIGGHTPNGFIGEKNREHNNERSKQQGVIFYILIASSAAALLIFGTLLTYFIITMRKINNNEEREPDSSHRSANSRSSSCNGHHVILKKQKAFIDVETSGKRYTRGKLSNVSSTTSATAVNEDPKDTETMSHHNNLYVSSFKFGAA